MACDSKQLCERNDALKTRRVTWDSLWQDLANYIMPRKAQVTEVDSTPDTYKHDRLYDTTIGQANMVLANGQMAWMTPMEEPWFSFDPPPKSRDDDEAKQWFQACTQITLEELANSNFYTQIHELYLDRGCFGTAILFAEPGEEQELFFANHDVGTYSVAENSRGFVDTVFREFDLSARAAAQKFGEAQLSKELQANLKNPKKKDQLATFIHAVYPRREDERESGKIDGINKPIASVYIEKKTQKEVQEGGFDEMPYFCTRYLKWGDSPYGWSPGWMALPEARQVNFLEEKLDVLAEVQVDPRMLYPDNMDGDVDLRAGGITYYNANNPNAIPREWMTGGRYEIGVERSTHRRKAINEAFHVDLFKMFSQIDKEMTAREVSERAAEKIIQFSPTFARMGTELFGPVLKRSFGILLRSGAFPPVPDSVLVQGENGEEASVPLPKVAYSSKIALAIKSLHNTSWARTMETMLPMADRQPDILDNYNMDVISRDTSRNDGMPPKWMRPMDDKMRAERAKQAQQAAEVEMQQKQADAAQKVASIDPEKAQQLQQMAQQ